ncbi:D-alanine--D-alanine ligase family protein [Hymenobacter weizhouensis]|uniref:D-alanine--D-alanine ligase family protein n=1 Tax=Hymenobacter sp. YIM 151500-1 TaxID=2987689 RepID=UPI002225DE85|nr:D-alanine--D-alanine ligase [Hymenobacter sp. YIM 151500-1]UYZ64751.1 D-alanine--D-alanine ligase [Hymenobacter sp. YIM 151500-1]
MKIGIFFGGPSREREISFAGGRTVYDNLDKALFEAVPVFVDSRGNFILLDWHYIYKGTIRDFYPPVSALPRTELPVQMYLESLGELSSEEQDRIISEVGRQIQPQELSSLVDFAFLALHGPAGEDGAIQGLLEWYGIPYSGSGILPSAFGIDKIAQKKLLKALGRPTPDFRLLTAEEWDAADLQAALGYLVRELGLPLVFKAPRQGSSIGVSILRQADVAQFQAAVERSLFRKTVTRPEWQSLTETQKIQWLQQLVDIREGIGLPVVLEGRSERVEVRGENFTDHNEPKTENHQPKTTQLIYQPEHLLHALNERLQTAEAVRLTSTEGETQVLVESFVQGREFSCIVVEDPDGNPLALPPTEIVKGEEMFDYRSKYLPGLSRKITPIDLPEADIQRIREACEEMFRTFGFQVYARLDGFISMKNEELKIKNYPGEAEEQPTTNSHQPPTTQIFLNDPNTTSGMLPASFFFHQAAEIGLNPSQFLTYLIRTSLAARRRAGLRPVKLAQLLARLDAAVAARAHEERTRTKVAVIMGGYSSERHISVESGRNIYEKLSSSVKYEPMPVFLTGNSQGFRLYVLPINVMLKDNADDIREKVEHLEAGHGLHPILERIRREAQAITSTYAGQPTAQPRRVSFEELAGMVDEVFIALHGRPGEDGALQRELEKYGLPYNGSGVESSSITINKFETNRRLRQAGLRVAEHRMASRLEWQADPEGFYRSLETQFRYPFIAKPADDGCSSAVKKIKNRAELEAFTRLIFRDQEDLTPQEATTLSLGFKEEFPRKDAFLVETLIDRDGAAHFLEITGGLLTHWSESGELQIEVFEASEALATGEVLSLEEKFLAGEGQNITPARYAPEPAERQRISEEVKKELRRVAEILNIQGYARIDAFVRARQNGAVEVIIIEVNSLPGMTPATCIFHQTALAGYTPYDFIDQILEFGKERSERLEVRS